MFDFSYSKTYQAVKDTLKRLQARSGRAHGAPMAFLPLAAFPTLR